MAKPLIQTTGRRKRAVARVRVRPGSGKITINKRDVEEYFPSETHRMILTEPLRITNTADVYDVEERVKSSTGLTRPDYFNWPDTLQDDVESYQPQVVVVTFGGNDGQPLKDDDGDYHDVGDPWREERFR